MGFILLALFAIAEIALVVVTFTKQKEKVQWLKNRMIVRAVETGIFLLALLFPQAAWDFRFKLCFFILLIRLVTAILVYAVKHKRISGNKSKFGGIVSALGGVILLGFSLAPAFLFSGYEGLETTGEYQVKKASAILIDQSRVEAFETDGSKREVPIYIYYPDVENAGEKSFPLVIFSHGAFGYYQSNSSTYMELASNGYVVVSLDHPYHSFFTEDTEGNLITVDSDFMQKVMLVNEETVSEEEIFEISREWMEIRTADIAFALDCLQAASVEGCPQDTWFIKSEEEKQEIVKVIAMTDTDTIGLMGHSMGGAASVALGREREDIDAVIDLDGTMLSERTGYENGIFQYYEEPYPVPVLAIDNQEHHEVREIQGELYVNNAVLNNAIDSKSTYFVGSGHMNFTDLPLFSPPLASLLGTGTIDEKECIETMNQIILEYFNCYLKGEGEVIIKESY